MWTRALFAFGFSCVLDLFLFAKSDDEKFFMSPKELTWDASEGVRLGH
jgi:hypothetical protein